MRLTTLLKLQYLASGAPLAGVSRTFAVGDDGRIEILLEAGPYMSALRVRPGEWVRPWHLRWLSDAARNLLARQRAASLDYAAAEFEAAIDVIGRG